jgi:hypothetical protein
VRLGASGWKGVGVTVRLWSGTSGDFSEAAGVCFRGELARDEQRSSIRASLLGRALGPFSYQLGRALGQDPV